MNLIQKHCLFQFINLFLKFEKLKRAKEVKISEEEKEEFEKEEEEEITKEGEIMGLTNLEEEQDILEEDIDSSKEELE